MLWVEQASFFCWEKGQNLLGKSSRDVELQTRWFSHQDLLSTARKKDTVLFQKKDDWEASLEDDCCFDAWTINFNKYKIIELAENKQLGTTNRYKYNLFSLWSRRTICSLSSSARGYSPTLCNTAIPFWIRLSAWSKWNFQTEFSWK